MRARAEGLARWVSIVLHPFAVFTMLALVAAWTLDRDALPRVAAGIAVAVGVVWAFVWQRWRSGRWDTVDASRRQERPLLYGLVLLALAMLWVWLGPTSPLARGVLAAGAMLGTAALLNRWVKLSLHMASLAFSGLASSPLAPAVGVAAIVLLPLLAWSRLRLRRHTWPEVLGGTLLGALAGLVT